METPKIIALIALMCIMVSAMGQTDTMQKKVMTPPDIIGGSDPHARMAPPSHDTVKHNTKKRPSADSNKRKQMNPSNKFEKP